MRSAIGRISRSWSRTWRRMSGRTPSRGTDRPERRLQGDDQRRAARPGRLLPDQGAVPRLSGPVRRRHRKALAACLCPMPGQRLARVGPTTPTRATARTRKEPTGEHHQAGSCQTAKDDGGKPGVRFLAQSKRRKVSGPGRSSVERDKEGDGFVHPGWEETKEGDAVHGAPLTIETGAGFPISRVRMVGKSETLHSVARVSRG